jgi:hypothetical protein
MDQSIQEHREVDAAVMRLIAATAVRLQFQNVL